jgi:site-specific DNA-methyltransferase (adenine-specific)
MLNTQVIYCADNLQKLRELPAASVDLIYIDPSFEIGVDVNTFDESDSLPAARYSRSKVNQHIELMRPRLVAVRDVLKERGSLYYQCDWRVDAYVRVMLDDIFGQENLRSHIIWRRGAVKGGAFRTFQNTHDSIFFYSKSGDYVFNPLYLPHDVGYIESYYKYIEPDTGRRYRLMSLTAPSKDTPHLTYEFLGVTRTWRWKKGRMEEAYRQGLIVQTKAGAVPMLKRYLDEQEGKPLDNMWTDILPLRSHSSEGTGYPTQKPQELLERIIQASTNEGDVVLDAFCGSGTSLVAAQKLGRRWIGIDISPTACKISAERLEKYIGVKGEGELLVPDLSHSVEELRNYSPLEFESWVISALNNISSEGSEIAQFSSADDTGLDLIIYPASEGKEKQGDKSSPDKMWLAVQVKRKEGVGSNDIKGFKTSLRRQGQKKGVFVAFSYADDARNETQRVLEDEGLEIKLLTVNEILSEGKKR